MKDFESICGSLLFDGFNAWTQMATSRWVEQSRDGLFIVIDSNVEKLHGDWIQQELEKTGIPIAKTYTLPSGEINKNNDHILAMYQAASNAKTGRRTPIMAIGGGVVGDMAGFFASTWLRGVPLILVPTTLLAQQDSSFGGKTGFNLPTGKNLVGSFYPAEEIIIEPKFLKTLEKRDLVSGSMELLKHAYLTSDEWADEILNNLHDWLQNGKIPKDIIMRGVKVKAVVVEKDPQETKGIRQMLNFGHTFAHALETVLGYDILRHGEAVGYGLALSLSLSEKWTGHSLGFSQARRIFNSGLLPKLPELNDLWPKFWDVMARDKKNIGKKIHWILKDSSGKAILYPMKEHQQGEVQECWHDLLD